jgi:hypothetical protein
MVVDPFWMGVFTTIGTEAILLVVGAIIAIYRKDK